MVVIHYLVLCFSSFLLAFLTTPALRNAAFRSGTLDYPNERKLHKEAVPSIGGIAIAVSFFVITGLGYALYGNDSHEAMVSLTGIFAGAAIISFVGVWDDLWVVKPRMKSLGQLAAVLVLMPFGFVIRELNIPFIGVVQIGWQLGIVLSIFWVAGIVNAMNFIDGMDGLAAGVAIAISAALFVFSLGKPIMAAVCLILVGSALGFLRYNFHPASIFMGDCGAMFLGFVLAAVSIKVIFQNPSITANCMIPVLIFGLPIMDTSWAIVRRTLRREAPYNADCFHTHNRLIKLGCSQRQAAFILYAASLLSISMGFIIYLTGSDRLAIILSAVMIAVALSVIAILGRAAPPPEPDIKLTD